MDPSRTALYQRLRKIIGKTPLYEIQNIMIPNENRIFVKEEYTNPTGSHYDRVFVELLYGLEREGKIVPGQELTETTSGNAGASFAWLCAVLGYKATVIIPEDMPSIRFRQIKSFGAELVFSKRGEYVAGVIERLGKYLKERKNRGNSTFCTNHAESQYSVLGMEHAGDEIVQDLEIVNIDTVNFYISALGGGINLTGVSNILLKRWPKSKMIGVEPFEAPDNYVKRFPGRFETVYGIHSHLGPHGLIGIGRWGNTNYRFPYIENTLSKVDDIILVQAQEWQDMSIKLRDIEGKHVGRTSAACLFTAMKIAHEVRQNIIVTIFYDPAWKYLDSLGGDESWKKDS